jgi:hypothetical protein
MVLPFLKRKEASSPGLIVKTRTPDEKPEENQEDDSSAAIHACAQDLILAVHSKDVKRTAEALTAAFEILDSMPHEEGEHINPHSYDAQNQKASENE